MATIRIETRDGAEAVRKRLAELRLLQGEEGADLGPFATSPGRWEVREDLATRDVLIYVPDDELESATKVIHKVIPEAIQAPLP